MTKGYALWSNSKSLLRAIEFIIKFKNRYDHAACIVFDVKISGLKISIVQFNFSFHVSCRLINRVIQGCKTHFVS